MYIKQLPRLALCLLFLWALPSHRVMAENDLQSSLKRELESFETIQNSYWIQLLNQDVISAPAIANQVNSQLYTIDFLIEEINTQAEEAGTPSPTHIPNIPRLHPDVASRLNFFRTRTTNFVSSQIAKGKTFNLNLTSIIPAPQGSHLRSNYPRTSLPTKNNLKCTTGGFVSESVHPDVNGLQRTPSLMNNFEHWNDRVCRTPTEVHLSLDGQKINISCSPGSSPDPNINSALSAMEMCDPLLYGFIPAHLQTQGRFLGGCSYPNEESIGRSFTYSDNIIAPNKQNPSGFDSKCDLIARRNISPNLIVPPKFKEQDRSLYMAAKIAIENRNLFMQQKQRINHQCSNVSHLFIERGHCQNLLHRISEVERIINILQTTKINIDAISPTENDF